LGWPFANAAEDKLSSTLTTKVIEWLFFIKGFPGNCL